MVRSGGVILLCAALGEGVGSASFEALLRGCASPDAFERRLADAGFFEIDQWMVQHLCQAHRRARILLYSDGLPEAVLRELLVEPVASPSAGRRARARGARPGRAHRGAAAGPLRPRHRPRRAALAGRRGDVAGEKFTSRVRNPVERRRGFTARSKLAAGDATRRRVTGPARFRIVGAPPNLVEAACSDACCSRSCRVPLLAGAARSAGDLPSVARPHLRVADQDLTQGLVFFLRVGSPPGVAAVGTAHAFELADLVEASRAEFTLGRGTQPVASSTSLLVAPGRPFNAPGASLKDDYVVYALAARPEAVSALEAEREAKLELGARVRMLGIPPSPPAEPGRRPRPDREHHAGASRARARRALRPARLGRSPRAARRHASA